MITNLRPDAAYFHALIEFERDIPLPAAATPENAVGALGDLRRVPLELGAGSVQPPEIRNPPSGGGCTEGSYLSQLAPLEAVRC